MTCDERSAAAQHSTERPVSRSASLSDFAPYVEVLAAARKSRAPSRDVSLHGQVGLRHDAQDGANGRGSRQDAIAGTRGLAGPVELDLKRRRLDRDESRDKPL